MLPEKRKFEQTDFCSLQKQKCKPRREKPTGRLIVSTSENSNKCAVFCIATYKQCEENKQCLNVSKHIVIHKA